MKLWLTRQHNGSYMLTSRRPTIARVEGTDYVDAYIDVGEPVGVRHLCAVILQVVGRKMHLKRGQSVRIDLNGTVLEDEA